MLDFTALFDSFLSLLGFTITLPASVLNAALVILGWLLGTEFAL